MGNNYNVLADYAVSRFIDRISGNDISNVFVDDDPAERVMVGMLSENRVDESFEDGYIENNSTRFESVPSITISFIVKKNSQGVMYIKPKGLLFYTVIPDYDKTVEYVIQKYSERDNIAYESIAQLCDCYPEEKFYLPLTYKKIDIDKVIDKGIELRLDSVKEKQFHLEEMISEKLNALSSIVFQDITVCKSDRITFFDLSNKERFKLITSISGEKSYPRWTIDVFCNAIDAGDSIRFTMQMVNKTLVNMSKNIGYLPKIFNAGLSVTGNENVIFDEVVLDYFKSSYKERTKVFVIAENTSASYNPKTNTIFTDNIPKYYQHRLKTKDDYNEYITFDSMIEDPIGNLSFICDAMERDYIKCEDEYNSTQFASAVAKGKFAESLAEYRREIDRFRKGIEQIKYKDNVKKSFTCMNLTFKTRLPGEHRSIRGWRLFQIVFIVSLICETIRSEYKDDRSISETDMEVANLLYFPTGGGKTEAFLGACVFAMFFDRYRGKKQGITALLKYPLRLLAVQQLDRVLAVVMKANIIKNDIQELKNTDRFSVGFFVGKDNTPNKITPTEPLSDRGEKNKSKSLILECDQDTLNDYYRFIDTCPCCGKKKINIRFNKEYWKLEHVCDNEQCDAGVLPLYIVDSEIYRYLPSIVVSTIDKMAMLGTSNEFQSLFGQVKTKCSIHGYSTGSFCACPICSNKNAIAKAELLKDPIPTLFIQDEMHLVKESLGTFDAHYESFINYYANNLVPESQRKRIRFIGATATIAMYDIHIKNLYHMSGRRFPCEYPSVKSGEDFYSYTDDSDITRILLGYAPYGRSITEGMWQSVYIMRLVVYRLIQHIEETYECLLKKGFEGSLDDLKNMLYDYWIELVYNNRKQDAIELENAFQNQGNNYLEANGIPKFVMKQMTSDTDFQAVRKALFDIQANRKNYESTNLLLATSTISHGVDEDSFNMMFFFGMPNNNAEYIQAYSRTGRKYTGIVIDIIRLLRIRDRSYLKNFILFHQNKDDLVESVPINRWAKNAIYSTLPGILCGLIMQYYTGQLGEDNLYSAVKVKSHLMNNAIRTDDVIDKIIGIYGCNSQEKMSLAYIDVIHDEVTNILSGIRNGNFSKDDFLSDAIARYSHGKKKPMRSLRDTEEQIEIQI